MEPAQELIDALCEDFLEHGTDAIEDLRKKDPGAYLQIILDICREEIEAMD